MSKFLKLVKENRPGEDIYTVELKDVNGELVDSFVMFGTGSPFENFGRFKEEFGSPIPIEDDEGLKDSVEAISAIANLPDQGALGQMTSSTARKLQLAKRKMANAALSIARKFDDASK